VGSTQTAGRRDGGGKAEGTNVAEHADEIWILVGVSVPIRAIGDAELMCAFLAQILERIALDRGAVLVDLLDGLGRDGTDRGGGIMQWRAIFHVRGQAAHREHAPDATHSICPAAEADEKYAIARSPPAQNGGIAVAKVSCDAQPRGPAYQLL